MTSAPRASGKDLEELHAYATNLVQSINARFGNEEENYQPVVWLERPVPIYERIALYSIADVAVVTATRDGMNLMPYEYIVCREAAAAPSMMVVSEFVGCSPSLSGAIRVNPWSIEAVRDGIYAAIRLSEAERGVRHQKHWKYVRDHTVGFWARSFIADLERMTGEHGKMQCYDLGFALDTFRMVSLKSGFKRLVGVTLEVRRGVSHVSHVSHVWHVLHELDRRYERKGRHHAKMLVHHQTRHQTR
ncbi:MAG: trehalose-6-phosphate synthase, partial [bacterium]